ncbi:AMP-binding protein [Breoghania sp.]|uniref:AMP-binding protein n=1 Tax=Breoghania sp. TaxID=2065378 RepID=UPI00260B3A5B|nr:AMP-binding protein [Breoghania sp.]MDJ0929836.1 AMP-binding protein [Breoghania sp.]
MILSTASTIERNHASGVWGRVALDALFRKMAQKHPESLALVDEPNRSSWTSGEARSLTYEAADLEISRLAGLCKALGLTPDSVIGLQLPNTTDAAVIVLAALRTGLIVTPNTACLARSRNRRHPFDGRRQGGDHHRPVRGRRNSELNARRRR